MKVSTHRVGFDPAKAVADVINDPPKGHELHSIVWLSGGYNATTHGNRPDQFMVIWEPNHKAAPNWGGCSLECANAGGCMHPEECKA